MCSHHVVKVSSSEQQLVELQIVIIKSLAFVWIVIILGEEARCAEYDTRQSHVAMEQLTQVFGRQLGHAIDVFWPNTQSFIHPYCWFTRYRS